MIIAYLWFCSCLHVSCHISVWLNWERSASLRVCSVFNVCVVCLTPCWLTGAVVHAPSVTGPETVMASGIQACDAVTWPVWCGHMIVQLDWFRLRITGTFLSCGRLGHFFTHNTSFVRVSNISEMFYKHALLLYEPEAFNDEPPLHSWRSDQEFPSQTFLQVSAWVC